MTDTALEDYTASPMAAVRFGRGNENTTVPCVAILWHADTSMIGRIAPLHLGDENQVEISRFSPEFRSLIGEDTAPLLDVHVSRQALRIEQTGRRTYRFTPPASKMFAEVNGRRLYEPADFSLDELGEDIVINLSNAVVLALFKTIAPLSLKAAKSGLVGTSGAIQAAWADIERFAKTNLPVLVRGETGTGKELAAKALHALSDRSATPFHSVNMATLSPALAAAELFGASSGSYTGADRNRRGLFEIADEATLFLDEIGDTPPDVQTMLLRALETGEYRKVGSTKTDHSDVRIIAATDRKIDQENNELSFSQPLFHRLESATVDLAPLRLRRSDIGLLLMHFFNKMVRDSNTMTKSQVPATLSAPKIAELALYSWPGNVRELANVAGHLALGKEPVFDRTGAGSMHTSAAIAPPSSIRQHYRTPSTVSDEEMIAALDQTGWNIKRTAESLRISRTALYRLMEVSPNVRSADELEDPEIMFVMENHPKDFDTWVRQLRVPRDALKQRMRKLNKTLS